jgi:hypothetical protein
VGRGSGVAPRVDGSWTGELVAPGVIETSLADAGESRLHLRLVVN